MSKLVEKNKKIKLTTAGKLLMDLPFEVFALIFEFFKVSFVLELRTVNKIFREFAEHANTWKVIRIRKFGKNGDKLLKNFIPDKIDDKSYEPEDDVLPMHGHYIEYYKRCIKVIRNCQKKYATIKVGLKSIFDNTPMSEMLFMKKVGDFNLPNISILRVTNLLQIAEEYTIKDPQTKLRERKLIINKLLRLGIDVENAVLKNYKNYYCLEKDINLVQKILEQKIVWRGPNGFGRFFGISVDGKPDGIGNYFAMGKLQFSGDVKGNSYVKGRKIIYLANTDKPYGYYVGTFDDHNKLHGKIQEYHGKDRLLFDGEYINGNKVKGKKYRADGRLWYDTQYYNRYPHGVGKSYEYIRKSRTASREFIGEFVNGQKECQKGTLLIYNQYGEYVGKYVGEFQNDLCQGNGSIFDHLDRLTYRGEFKNNKCVGKRTLLWTDILKIFWKFKNENC